MNVFLGSLFLVLLTALGSCENQQIEIGTITWERNYEKAVEKSKESGKPIFLLFQEVPGCQGCQDFGKDVLSNPLIKKSVEEAFIPLMIRNNASSGHDQEILKKFREPAWNYQVIRFLTPDGEDIIPRKDKVWTAKALSERMIQALKKEKKKIPPALDLVHLESDTEHHEVAAFAMYCFWTGEAELGRINGVLSTEAGWLDGREVTLVKFHVKTLPLSTLVTEAKKVDCAQAVYLPSSTTAPAETKGLRVGVLDNSYRPAKESDQKKQLTGTKIKPSQYTPAQLTKINAFIRHNLTQAKSYL